MQKNFKEECYNLIADAAFNGCIHKLCNGKYNSPNMIDKCVDEYNKILELLVMWELKGGNIL